MAGPPAALAARLHKALKTLSARGQRLGVCETSAGGFIASTLLAQPGASKFFAGGVVAYSMGAKQTFLGLEPEASKPTSTEPHAIELASALRTALDVEWAIGETGVAGPSANSRGISPGVCALAVVGPSGATSRMLYPTDTLSAADAYGQPPKLPRDEAMRKFADAALETLCEAVEKEAGP